MATTVEILTAEEFAKLTDDERPTELVRGKVIARNVPAQKHGYICSKMTIVLGSYVDVHALGRVMSNDAAVITERNPDSVRGADVSFYSYARLPEGPLPDGYLTVVPELVVEVLSPDDRWSNVQTKTLEYLKAGVSIVCIIDPKSESAHLYAADQPPRTVAKDADLTFPEILGGFRVPVAKLFE